MPTEALTPSPSAPPFSASNIAHDAAVCLLSRVEAASAATALTYRLAYHPPYDFAALLDFLRGRALPGVESVDDISYARVIGTLEAPGWLQVSQAPDGQHALRLTLHGVAPDDALPLVMRIRRMFDLDARPHDIAQVLSRDARLADLVMLRPGLRMPSGWSGFEIAVRAIIGQQVSVAAARTLTSRLAQQYGQALPQPLSPGLAHYFPHPEALCDADLTAIGLMRSRAATVRTVARAVVAGQVDFAPTDALDTFVSRWVALPGIGPWTAHYIAMRALGHPDAFPAEDLVLQKALPNDGSRLTAKALSARAVHWRPWRAYAVMQLWRDAMQRPATAPLAPAGRPSAA